MRYIGNKSKLLKDIESLLIDKGIYSSDLVFCDAFSGTASVAEHFKHAFKKIIANDSLYFAYVIAEGKLNATNDMFDTLGFDPFEYFNSLKDINTEGFIYKNYAPSASGRMYFSDENAKFIDHIRLKIDEWASNSLISETEKYFLIASLVESVSYVANVAGVYGNFLKTWDPRALKKMVYKPITQDFSNSPRGECYNENILDFISKVKGDILYLDPPYTKNQYATQYHILETIARNDNPEIHGKGGLRDSSSVDKSFSRDYEVQAAFEKLIRKAQFKYIIVSYSSDGLMSKEYIKQVLKRFGKAETLVCKEISYRRYKNAKAETKKEHKEYLFFVEKKPDSTIYFQSPLNYIGGKGEMIGFLKEHMPDKVDTFYDLFAGGFNVGINSDANQIVYNDLNFKVKELIEYIASCDIVQFQRYIAKTIKKYGLTKKNKESYIKLREKYNTTALEKRDVRDLFLLVMYGFQQQIRFNSSYNYNNPVGMAGFNDKILEKLISFSDIAKSKDIVFCSTDYYSFLDQISQSDFVYLDPPYLITLGSYNDGKRGFNGWSPKEEKRLLEFLDELNRRNIKFMLSNVLVHKEKRNTILSEWIEKNQLNVVSFDGKMRSNRKEVIVLNY